MSCSLLKSNIISPDHPCISNPTFDFFPKQDGKNYNNCSVNFNIQAKTSPKKAVKRQRVIVSDNSSQKDFVRDVLKLKLLR